MTEQEFKKTVAKKLIITEKPSVARDFARVLNVSGKQNGYIENDGYVISWCVGHLVEMLYPEAYDEKYAKWRLEDLPFLPRDYKYGVIKRSQDQYKVVNSLLHREDIDTVYWAGDSGKEGCNYTRVAFFLSALHQLSMLRTRRGCCKLVNN